MPKVKVGDINIYYEVHGEGEPLVMICGATVSLDLYFQHIPVFSKEYQVVAYDPRGAGRSDAPNILYTMEMMADDLAGLLDAIGIEQAHIYGASMGGMIAQHFALRYPKRTRSLILACTSCGDPHAIPQDEDIKAQLAHIQGTDVRENLKEAIRLSTNNEFFNNNQSFIEEYISKITKYPATPHGATRQMQAAMVHNTYEQLTEIKAPTLVIHGEDDLNVPVENAQILASRIPEVELVILKNAGHLFGFEAFDESNRIILDFLGRHSGK